jgi:RHS repeat-associated protein
MLRGSTASFYNADGLGSVTSLSNGAGALAQTYSSDSFGKQTASSGSSTNPFQYAARESDAETNLYFYRTRYYDPSTGRFMNEDLIRFEGGSDFYTYVRNSPVSFIDPLGLNAKPAPPGLINQLQGLFPGSTFDGTTLTIPLACTDVMNKLRAQGYQDSNSWGWNGPLSQFWNPFNHSGGWEWRTNRCWRDYDRQHNFLSAWFLFGRREWAGSPRA